MAIHGYNDTLEHMIIKWSIGIFTIQRRIGKKIKAVPKGKKP